MTEQITEQPPVTVTPTEPEVQKPTNFWGTSVIENFDLGDGIQYFQITKMNEGERQKYESQNAQDLVLDRQGSSRMRIDQSKERQALLLAAVVGWRLFKNNQEVKFSKSLLQDFLQNADTALIDRVVNKIRKMNPWLTQDLTVEQIDEQIEQLRELRETAAEREAGEDFSATR